jgi:dimeric dUTPase (all-alpha-NTP-PPase superfamily)
MEKQDKLEEMYAIQEKFQKNFFDVAMMTDEEKVKFTKENILSLHRELGEVLNETPWKTHRANMSTAAVDKIGEEMIDCYKFMLNLFIIWGFTPSDMAYLFKEKSRIVQERYDNEKDSI